MRPGNDFFFFVFFSVVAAVVAVVGAEDDDDIFFRCQLLAVCVGSVEMNVMVMMVIRFEEETVGFFLGSLIAVVLLSCF